MAHCYRAKVQKPESLLVQNCVSASGMGDLHNSELLMLISTYPTYAFIYTNFLSRACFGKSVSLSYNK